MKPMIVDAELLDLCQARVERGQKDLCATMAMLVRREDPAAAAALRRSGSQGFLEPLLYAYLHHSHATAGRPRNVELSQIAWGYSEPGELPHEVSVHADAVGRVVVPRLGYFLTEAHCSQLRLARQHDGLAHSLAGTDGVAIPFSFEPPLSAGNGLEIVRHANPLYDAIFMRDDGSATGRPLDRPVTCLGERHAPVLCRALEMLKEQLGAYHGLITRVIRQLFIFDEPGVLSFARLSAHGAVFINAGAGICEEPYFIQELVCRGAVTLLGTMCLQPRQYFNANPYERLDHFGITWGGDRNVYTALHGMFYECMSTLCLHLLHERRAFSGRKAHEVWGRLAYLHSRCRHDIHELMLQGGVLSDVGREFYRPLARQIQQLRDAGAGLPAAVLTNQVGAFSYERFVELNPRPAGP